MGPSPSPTATARWPRRMSDAKNPEPAGRLGRQHIVESSDRIPAAHQNGRFQEEYEEGKAEATLLRDQPRRLLLLRPFGCALSSFRFASLRSSDPMLFPPFLFNVVSFLLLGRSGWLGFGGQDGDEPASDPQHLGGHRYPSLFL
ncbi:hypothetical protein GW17_00002903 [Ensete ventricosum]|nr:hypothetical protein GW17_00002903 [Ensete ventricosum]